MKKKKMFIVIWDLGPGGIQKRMRDVALEINKNYLQWDVYFLIRKKVTDDFTNVLINKEHIRLIYYPWHKIPKTIFIYPLWLLFEYIIYQPDAIITFLAHYSSATALIRKIVFWHKSYFVINEGVITSEYLKLNKFEYLRPLVKIFYNSADKIIVPTNACQKDLIINFRIKQSIIKIIPSWSLVKPNFQVDKEYDLIFIGRLTEEKDPLGFVSIVREIYKNNKSIKALIVGSGYLKQQVIKTIEEYKLSNIIKYIEFSNDVTNLLLRSRILVLTSKNEGMPNVVLEAAMCNVPAVISSFVGSNEVVIHNKTGYVCNTFDNMVFFINKLMLNQSFCQKIGRRARNRVALRNANLTQTKFIKTLLIK